MNRTLGVQNELVVHLDSFLFDTKGISHNDEPCTSCLDMHSASDA